MRLWRSDFMKGGVEALRKSIAPGPASVKAECALAVAEEVLVEHPDATSVDYAVNLWWRRY